MKKITALIVMALLITIGGVYATWQYAQNGTDLKTETIQSGIAMAGVTTGAKKGVITLDVSGASVIIDDQEFEGDVVDHTACLLVSGSVKVNFAANSGADDEVVTNGVKMRYKFEITSGSYDDKSGVSQVILKSEKSGVWQDLGFVNGDKMIEIADDWALELGGIFYLPSYQDFLDFKDVVDSINIKVTVEEYEGEFSTL